MNAGSVTIKSPVTGPDAPEEEAVETPVAEEAVTETESTDSLEIGTDDVDRPEWLPEKFNDPEDLAKAYGELEKKLGANPEGAEEQPAKELMNFDAFAKYSEEYGEKGELSEKSYSELESMGFHKDLVDSFAAGQDALAMNESNGIMNEVGGSDNYTAMAQWAEESLSAEELAAFNETVSTGSNMQKTVAVKGLYARYQSESSSSPSLVKGSPSAEALMPFRSNDQVVKAMADPRYKVDPAYRQEVERRLEVSDLF